MKLVIEIECDNAAFEDNPREVADILENLASRMPYGIDESCEMGLFDSNGNHVGECRLADAADAKLHASAPALLAALQLLETRLTAAGRAFYGDGTAETRDGPGRSRSGATENQNRGPRRYAIPTATRATAQEALTLSPSPTRRSDFSGRRFFIARRWM